MRGWDIGRVSLLGSLGSLGAHNRRVRIGGIAYSVSIKQISSEVMHLCKLSSRAPRQHDSLCATTVHTKQPLLRMVLAFARRIADYANQLGGIAYIFKSGHFASDVLHF